MTTSTSEDQQTSHNTTQLSDDVGSFTPRRKSSLRLSSSSSSSTCNNNNNKNDDDAALTEELISVDQVSQMMREQDAELLEHMHYEASQVSQYSSGGTPNLKPTTRAPPIDEDPLLLTPLTLAAHPQLDGSSSWASKSQPEIRITNIQGDAISPSFLTKKGSHRSVHSRTASLGVVKEGDAVASWDTDASDRDLKDDVSSTTSRFRRLLSGEIRSVDLIEDAVPVVAEEGETIASPVSVAHEAAAAALKQQQKKETGLAEQRRVREAIQFAEAVGESLSINRDELRIIEDHTDDGESDDDDDDGCKFKEIIVSEPETIQEPVNPSQTTLELTNSSANAQDAQEGSQTSLPSLPSHVDIPPRKTKRPQWPFGPAGSDYDRFLDSLSDGSNPTNFVYKGICANPPEITQRGIQRGNYAQLHRKAWLEVSDKYHRYGKNLRLYYRYWERLGFPTNQFFDWLDSKGEAAGHPLPNLDECPRSILDSDTVLYINNPEITEGYALDLLCNEEGRARIVDVDGRPIVTGQDGWIFVLRDNVMYGAEKITSITGHSKQRFHHSSFFGGKAVAAAGIIITDEQGYLTRLYPHSGHYRPGESHMQRMLFFLHRKGVDLRTFEMDTQQFRHVSREKDANKSTCKDGEKKKDKSKDSKDGEKKSKKIDNLHLEKAVNVACFLAHKASFIGNGIFDNIHKIRKADATSVSEALNLVDNGGFWQRSTAVEENKLTVSQ